MNKVLYQFLLLVFITIHAAFGQKPEKVEAICVTVKNLSNSLDFYTKILNFKLISIENFNGDNYDQLFGKFNINYNVAHLQLGNEKVDLIDFVTFGGRSIPENFTSNDLRFQHIAIVVSDMEKAFEILKKNNVSQVSNLPQTIPITNKAAAGIKAFYFMDIDNHVLELIYFPAGKGKQKWQNNVENQIFLGIDHTAFAVDNNEQSTIFWKEAMAFEKKGESHNYGTEQEHLNGVQNCDVSITGFGLAKEGVGVEFLKYNKPEMKMAVPDTKCDDTWNWFIKIQVTNLEGYLGLMNGLSTKTIFSMVSEKIVKINGKGNLIVRDPNGHAVWLYE